MMGGNGWVVAVNLVIWTGIFLYLLRLDRQVGELERGGADLGESNLATGAGGTTAAAAAASETETSR
jgi:CcmD family protein